MSEKSTTKTQNEVVKGIADQTGLPATKVKEVLEAQSAMATEELKNAGTFLLYGIGKMKAKESAERQGRNPKTGEAVTIKASRRVNLSLNKGFKERVQ